MQQERPFIALLLRSKLQDRLIRIWRKCQFKLKNNLLFQDLIVLEEFLKLPAHRKTHYSNWIEFIPLHPTLSVISYPKSKLKAHLKYQVSTPLRLIPKSSNPIGKSLMLLNLKRWLTNTLIVMIEKVHIGLLNWPIMSKIIRNQ